VLPLLETPGLDSRLLGNCLILLTRYTPKTPPDASTSRRLRDAMLSLVASETPQQAKHVVRGLATYFAFVNDQSEGKGASEPVAVQELRNVLASQVPVLSNSLSAFFFFVTNAMTFCVCVVRDLAAFIC
jgi:hypothetical protein